MAVVTTVMKAPDITAELGTLEQARRALALADSLPEVMRLINGAELAREYVKRANASEHAQREWAEYSLRAQRKAGEILRATPKAKGGGDQSTGNTVLPVPTLKDVLGADTNGEAKMKAARWQDVADIPAPVFEEYVANAAELTRSRLLRLGRDHKAEQKRRIAVIDAIDPDAEMLRMDLRTGDFRTALADIPDGTVDAVITDPPYPWAFLPLLPDLARLADRVLTPDGILAVLFGQTHLPEVYRLLSGGRPYRWTMAYLTPGAGYSSMARRLQSNWKPVLIYGAATGLRFADTVQTDRDDKAHHHWGQDVGGFVELVRQLTPGNGAHVLDPFLGGGTTALAAQLTGRHFTGCDIDPACITTTRQRVSAEPEADQ